MARRSTRRSKTRTHALMLATYTAAIFLSALLLFGVQPMFTRMVLPRLGGSPSVWSVALVFFQSMLLAGYAYAHVLTIFRQRYAPVAIHLALLLVAALALPLGIVQGWGAPPVTDIAALWLLELLQSRSACRSSRYPPAIRCCRPGSCAPAIPMRTIRTFFTRHRTSGASLRCSRIPRCSSRLLHYRCKIECGASALCCSSCWSPAVQF